MQAILNQLILLQSLILADATILQAIGDRLHVMQTTIEKLIVTAEEDDDPAKGVPDEDS